MEDPYERAHQMEVENMKKEKSKEKEAAFKLNGHPYDTFEKDKSVYGVDAYLKEVKFDLFRKNQKSQSSTSISMKINGRPAAPTSQASMAISRRSLPTRKIHPRRRLEFNKNNKEKESNSEG
jgi:hypothetical protein